VPYNKEVATEEHDQETRSTRCSEYDQNVVLMFYGQEKYY
jgi:hypothetical protein